MAAEPIRLTVVATHPTQYAAPWFRYVATHCPEIDLTVVYAARPTPSQQGVDFGRAFEWDRLLDDGYRSVVVRDGVAGAVFDAHTFRGLDVPEIGSAVLKTHPDVVLVAGWHSMTLVRAIAACWRRRIPILYRGDSHLGLRPSGYRRIASHVRTRALLHLYSGHLAVGTRSREYLMHHGVSPTRIYASPHAVDNGFFASEADRYLQAQHRATIRATCGAAPDDFVVLFAGKLIPRKRPLDAVRAVAGLGSRAVLILVGCGELENATRAEAERLGVRIACVGFQNQTDIARMYAAADCLAVPSVAEESWGLVVNEAMATGLPVVVSEITGCAPDLVTAGETGEVFRTGDVEGLTAALGRVRGRGARATMSQACRRRIAAFGFEQASVGLVAACQALAQRRDVPRVVMCAGGMVTVGGLERMTLEVLRVVREHGGAVHCILNSWENHRIVPRVEAIGASWSTGLYWYTFSRGTRNPVRLAQMAWDTLRTSAGLLVDALRFGATHVLIPEYGAVLRNAPALAVLRLTGVAIVFRMGNAPERGRFYDVLWRRAVSPFVTRFVPNSQFGRNRLQETGVSKDKITLIRNAPSRRDLERRTDKDVLRLVGSRRTILTVGQIAPFKGTHLAVDVALQLIRSGYDVQAVIVGDIPAWPADLVEYAHELQQRVERAGAADRVHFVGGREEVPAIMRASYVLAAPILQEETFGNVVLEARHAGLPVVTFNRGGLTELVSDRETGFVCRTADIDGLLEGLRYFLDQPAERERASANSLAMNGRPGEQCTQTEFDRRWWAIFEPASRADDCVVLLR